MDFIRTRFTRDAIANYRKLFAECFPSPDRFTPDYVEWMYAANPDGKVVGFDAYDGDCLAAHYVCLPAVAKIDGVETKILLSLNTATRPAYQGKGLFTKLAEMTYQAGAEEGFGAIYGVANANSTPGFIRKLGFQLVRPLEARIGWGRFTYRASVPDLAFERRWSPAAIEWRCANPYNHTSYRRGGGVWQFHAKAVGQFLSAYAELPRDAIARAPQTTTMLLSPMRLFIGLLPDEASSYWNYVSIPDRLRPSPLNLIYRSLTAPSHQLDPRRIRFTYLDFDAY